MLSLMICWQAVWAVVRGILIGIVVGITGALIMAHWDSKKKWIRYTVRIILAVILIAFFVGLYFLSVPLYCGQ